MPASVNLFTHIVSAGPQHAMEDCFIKTPDLQHINGLFAHIDVEHQELKNINDPETSIREHAIRILDTPLPGVEFWRTRTMLVRNVQGKRSNHKGICFAGSSLSETFSLEEDDFSLTA